MSQSLCWIPTPNPKTRALRHSTWTFLAAYMDTDNRGNLHNIVFDKTRLDSFSIIALTAKASLNKDLLEDMEALIEAIKKHGSITLIVE